MGALKSRPATALASAAERLLWEVPRAARALTRRFGSVGWAAVIVLGAAALSIFFVGDEHLQAERLQARLTAQAASTPAAMALRLGSLPTGRARLKAFEEQLLAHEDIPGVVQDILRAAEDEGLWVQRGEYRAQVDAKGGFVRYRMNLPVQGAAPAVHRFIAVALRKQRSLALESVQFRRERIGTINLEARIQWVLLTQLPVRRGSPLALAASAGVGP